MQRQAYARTIIKQDRPISTFENPHSRDEDTENHRRAVASFDSRQAKKERQEYEHIADQIARSDFYSCNWPIPDGKKLFPNDPEMRCVSRHYPLSRFGILLVDVFFDDQSEKKSIEKQKILKSLGYKVVIVKEGIQDFEYQTHEQLR